MGEKTINGFWKTFGLMFASAAMLTVIHPPLNVSFLAWVAWVPFMLACDPKISVRRLLICAYLGGLCFWFGNIYWLMIVSSPGYIAFSIVQAFYWPLLALSVRFIRQRNLSLFLAAPVIFVGAEAVQSIMFTGFSWYYLAHSQYENLRLIQICDVFGTLGVSVLIAMGNGLVAQYFLKQKTLLRGWRIELAIFCALLAGTYLYGSNRLAETPDYQTRGPLVGSVQPNVPAWVKEEMDNGQEIIDDMIADSDACFEAGAVLVAWPETMVLAAMNPQYLSTPGINPNSCRYHQQILDHCKDQGYVLFGAHAADIGIRDGQYEITNQYNSAYLYRPDGTADPKIYHKIHLVPFGEFIPFRNIPLIYRLFMLFNPYGYDYSLTPGTAYTTFQIESAGKHYHFGTLICYEDTDPTVTRKHVLDENGLKKVDWLVNVSNDGWYVHFKKRQVIPMVELAQRTAISVFRCVENRVSIIRSVNTGISCLIEPTGKIRDSFKMGNLPGPAMARQGVGGWFVDTIPIDSRITFFSKYGRWLDILLGSGWSIILLLSIYYSWKQRRKSKIKEGTKK